MVTYKLNDCRFRIGLRNPDGSFVYDGNVKILVNVGTALWEEQEIDIDCTDGVTFRNLGVEENTRFPNGDMASEGILGFTQMADDDLRVINFIHTFQISEAR